MICKYVPSMEEKVLSYIGDKYSECLYLYIDFVKYSGASDFVDTYIQFQDEKITFLILKYHTGVHIFSRDMDFEKTEIIQLLERLKPTMICGTDTLLKQLQDALPEYVSQFGYIGEITKVEKKYISDEVEPAKESEFHTIAEMICGDEGLGGTYQVSDMEKQLLERKHDGFGRNRVIRRDGVVVSHVATGAELSHIAVTNATITLPQYRGQALASNLVATICQELLEENKRVFAIYYTPSAYRMHEKVGHKVCNGWGKLTLKKEK